MGTGRERGRAAMGTGPERGGAPWGRVDLVRWPQPSSGEAELWAPLQCPSPQILQRCLVSCNKDQS